MFKLLIILAIIVAILLILIVLVQNSKGGGLSSQFGGSGANQVIGVKKTTDLLEKVTWGFAIALLALSLASGVMVDSGNSFSTNPNIDKAIQQLPSQNALPPAEDGGLNLTVPADSVQ
ncbi:MAG: preprotein translocase subunit SecG [Roseivirga sp.]|jgi:preprotein translocase subunit SecG